MPQWRGESGGYLIYAAAELDAASVLIQCVWFPAHLPEPWSPLCLSGPPTLLQAFKKNTRPKKSLCRPNQPILFDRKLLMVVVWLYFSEECSYLPPTERWVQPNPPHPPPSLHQTGWRDLTLVLHFFTGSTRPPASGFLKNPKRIPSTFTHVLIYFCGGRSREMAVLPLGAGVTPLTSPAQPDIRHYLTPRRAEAQAASSARVRHI